MKVISAFLNAISSSRRIQNDFSRNNINLDFKKNYRQIDEKLYNIREMRNQEVNTINR